VGVLKMPDITLEGNAEITSNIEVYCHCGAGLCNQTTVEYRKKWPGLVVEPCSFCLEKARKEGFNEGYGEGYKDGMASSGDK
jgi:hypothetical protein